MKLIIAGGRSYQLSRSDFAKLDAIPEKITEVVSGGAQGVDGAGECWARNRAIPVRVFPADWQTHGRAAGPIRNAQMADYADAVALFPGGKGTESMRREATKRGLKIFEFST